MKETYIYIFVIISMIFGSFITTGCNDDFKYSKDYSVYDGVTLNINMTDENNVLNLNLVNTTYRVRVSVTPNNVKINSQEYLYEIDDETIATVDENGLLTMKKEGEAKLTVKLAVRPEISTSCIIKVKPIVVNKLYVPENITIKQGETKDITEEISITPSIANCILDYHIDDGTIASIDKNGIITAISDGNTIITVSTTDGSNLSETIKLSVEGKKLITEIELPIEELEEKVLLANNEFNIGELTKILPKDAEDPTIKFSVIDGNDVVSITEEGLITCLKAGEAVVQAEAQDGSNVKREITITVYNGTYNWEDRTNWTVATSALYEDGLDYLPDGTTGKPEDILDGDSKTFLSIRKPEYFTSSDNPNKEIYFIVNTQEETTFNMIKYVHRQHNHYLAAIEIEVSGSDDGTTFTLIKNKIDTKWTDKDHTLYEIIIPYSTYKFIKVKVTDWTKYVPGGLGSAIQIAEFNVGTVE